MSTNLAKRGVLAVLLLLAGEIAFAADYSVTITSPASDAAVRANAGDVTLQVKPSQPLKDGAAYQVVVDGAVLPQRFEHDDIALTNLGRGTHTVEVRVVGPRGNVLSNEASVTFHLQRYSRLFEPNAVPPEGGVRQAPRAPAAPRSNRFQYNPGK
jgi:hypothetical protein